MAAVSFTRSSEIPYLSHAVSISSLGVLGISIVPVMVLVAALLTSLVDRLQQQSALLDELFEQASAGGRLNGRGQSGRACKPGVHVAVWLHAACLATRHARLSAAPSAS